MTFSHDSIEVPFPGIYEALEMLESGTWKYFIMDYEECKFIQAAYDKKDGFTVESRNGKQSDVVARNAKSKEEAIGLIREASQYYYAKPPKAKKSKKQADEDEPVLKKILPHVQISIAPVVIYGVLVACVGFASWKNLLMSLGFMAGSLLFYNLLFDMMRNGFVSRRRGPDLVLAERPVAFFLNFMFSVFLVLAAFGGSLFALNASVR